MQFDKPEFCMEPDEARLALTALRNSYFSLKQKWAGEDPEAFFKEREALIRRLSEYVSFCDSVRIKRRKGLA